MKRPDNLKDDAFFPEQLRRPDREIG